MPTMITLPQLGSTMLDGKIVAWFKREGDPVQAGEDLVEVETDKVTVAVEAPAGGILGPILAATGQIVPVGAPLGSVLAPGEWAAPAPEAASAAGATPPAGVTPGAAASERLAASPNARRIARELGVDLAQVQGTGPGGRIVEDDVRRHAETQTRRVAQAERVTASPVARRLAQDHGIDLETLQGSGPGGRIVKEDVEAAVAQAQPAPQPPAPVATGEPLHGIRRIVAERMTQSFTSTPHFYLTAEVDATALQRLREGLLARIEAAAGARLTITDILVKICAQTLAEFPEANTTWTEQAEGGVVRHAEVHIGVAVGLDNGLVVPVIHRADQLTLGEIARRRADLVERARASSLTLTDLEAGAFTISNLGMYRVDQFQAIINPPQSMILAVGRIRERPWVVDGQVLVRPALMLTLSVDHRLLDGVQAARFLERLVQLVEEPYLLLT